MAGSYDAAIIGSGPNGLTAAIVLARAGLKVRVVEAAAAPGGGARTAELTLPGFLHDVCSAVHPMALASPVFRTLPLAEYGVEWIHPSAPLAHPLDDGAAVMLDRSIGETARGLGEDATAYRSIVTPFVERWEALIEAFLAPIHFPRHPLKIAAFGVQALRPAESFARSWFEGERARALFAGIAGHSLLPLDKPGTAAFGLLLGILAHAVCWPIPKGGSQFITDAMCSYLRALGGEIETGARVDNIDQFADARAVLCDLTPRELLRIAGHRFTSSYRHCLERYRYGPGVFKVDWALAAPIPWKAACCARAGTVHLGGTMEEIAASERAAWSGKRCERPFVLLAQPSLFDPSRAPAGRHTAWAYCHVPNGSRESFLDCIENQIERFAPGFRETILARHTFTAAEMERYNANYAGGDINGGAQDLSQLFIRPSIRLYRTSARGVYICSAASPPGGGVHGMCGYYAAKTAIQDLARTRRALT